MILSNHILFCIVKTIINENENSHSNILCKKYITILRRKIIRQSNGRSVIWCVLFQDPNESRYLPFTLRKDLFMLKLHCTWD